MKILCYGDSNTYGYDPASFFGGRYAPESRWCDLLAAATGNEVINCGENGRSLPCHSYEFEDLRRTAQENAPLGLLILMLGTNDVLMDSQQPPQEIAARMEKLLSFLQDAFPRLPVLLLSPPPVRLPVRALEENTAALAPLYKQLALKKGVLFCDTSLWKPPLACDGVHFSPAGHRVFADRLAEVLSSARLFQNL